MNRLSILLAFLFIAGCNGDSISTTESDGAEGLSDSDLANLCAELAATRKIETSKRMDILKSYGFEPIDAKTVELGFEVLEYLASSLSAGHYVQDHNPGFLPRVEICSEKGSLDNYNCSRLLKEIDGGMTYLDFASRYAEVKGCIEWTPD